MPKFRKTNKFRNKTKNYMDNVEYEGSMPKGPIDEGIAHTHISAKALRDLPRSSYSIKADPYQAILPAATPYDIMGKFLKTVGGNYAGDDNIDGGNVQQYANSSSSKFLAYFDSMRMNLALGYRYLPIKYGKRADPNVEGDTDIGVLAGMALVDENLKAMSEAISQLQSTTFTALAVNNFAIKTNLNMGSHARNDSGATTNPYGIYTSKDEVLYGLSMYYQLFLQEVLSTMNYHNSFRLKQGTAIRDAWSREVPFLNAFFGLMNKKAFLSLLESINLSFEGEYIDRDFMEQTNLLTLMPSRRSNSITDPVLEIKTRFERPTIFQVYLLDDIQETEGVRSIKEGRTAYFDDANMKATVSIANSSTVEQIPVTIWDACNKLKEYFTLKSTKEWARSVYNEGLLTSDTARYNNIKNYFDVIIHCMVQFKPKFSDYRECLDTMTRTGTINWFKGFRPSITKDTDAPLFQNLIVDDIYKMVMSGAEKITFNNSTKRYETFSQWNIYAGVPEYDSKQGGAFITFSAKNLSDISGNEGIEYLPRMFDVDKDSVHGDAIVEAVSRDGHVAFITTGAVTMNSSTILKRLVPLGSQSGLQIRVPTVAYSSSSSGGKTITWNTFDATHYSTLYKTLTQVFGLCRVKTTAAGSYDYALDPDLICVYQVEITDITNAAITYARANAPFRGTTSDQGILGFFGMSRGK